MKHCILRKLNQLSAAVVALLLVLVQGACSTASDEAWGKIQSEGLIPYLVEANTDAKLMRSAQQDVAGEGEGDDRLAETGDVDPMASFNPRVAIAEAVPGKPGFVYSPHMAELSQVDVRDYQPGERVRCPYTKKSFFIPGERSFGSGIPSVAQLADAADRPVEELVDQPAADRAVEELASGPTAAEITPKPDPTPTVDLSRIPELTLQPKPDAPMKKADGGGEKIPTSDELLDLHAGDPVDEVPVGRRVPGKPNYVFSPFAASNQVVDVEGHAPGTKVKCPYSGKVFAVPAE